MLIRTSKAAHWNVENINIHAEGQDVLGISMTGHLSRDGHELQFGGSVQFSTVPAEAQKQNRTFLSPSPLCACPFNVHVPPWAMYTSLPASLAQLPTHGLQLVLPSSAFSSGHPLRKGGGVRRPAALLLSGQPAEEVKEGSVQCLGNGRAHTRGECVAMPTLKPV